MIQHAFESSLKLLGIGTNRLTTAFAMRKGDHAVHVLRKPLLRKTIGNQLGCVGRAVTRRHDSNVVTSTNAAVRAHIAKEAFTAHARMVPGDWLAPDHFGGTQFF